MVNIFICLYTYIYFYALHNIGTPILLLRVIMHIVTCLHQSYNNMAAVYYNTICCLLIYNIMVHGLLYSES